MRAAMVRAVVVVGALAGLTAGCDFVPYRGDPNTVIARPYDTAGDTGSLPEGGFAIVYDGDGCQNWIRDDGVEGYSSPRFNPETGKPVCDSKYPPGTVLGRYESKDNDFPDFVPRPRKTN
jgi:hypothetical protein